jgi:hypothetical protein
MKTKYTNSIVDLLNGTKSAHVAYRMWGAMSPVSMGDGIKFRVTKSKVVDYVYVRYLGGYDDFELEFGALVGTEYDVIDRVKPVSAQHLVKTISYKLFSLDIAEQTEELPKASLATIA